MRRTSRLRPARFAAFLVLFAAGSAVAGLLVGPSRGLILGFDGAAIVFLLSLLPLMKGATPRRMRAHAADNDGGRITRLAIATLLALVALVTVGSELGRAGASSAAELAVAVVTLALAWTFGNLMFALHYAHLYYDRGVGGADARGLSFPGTEAPDYWDFCYFAATLGMAFQVSDVAVTSARVRRAVTGHALAAFVYNIGVLSLTINIVAGGM